MKKVPSLDISIFEDVIANGGADRRMALARQLAALVADSRTPPGEREDVTPCLLKLLMDPVKDIRAEIVRILRPVAGLHPDIVFAIAADEEDIALPFLNLSPSVTGVRQMAVFKAGDVLRRKALARRCDVDARVVEAIALEGEAETVLELLNNPALQLDNASAKRIYVRFRDDARITGLLLERPDLPLEIRIAHVRATSEKLRAHMNRTGWLAANDAGDVIAETEERAMVDILARARDSEELMASIGFMSRKNALTPSVILRAACHGHVAVLEHALAHLSGMSPERVHRLACGKGALSLRAVYNKSGLPQSCFMLVRAIFDVARALEQHSFGKARLSPEAFGRKVLERMASGYAMIPVAEKARLIDLLARFADDDTREMARRLGAGLQKAA